MFQFDQAFQGEIHQPYLRRGVGRRAALLIHGFPGTPSEMRRPADFLYEAGWTVHAPLLPGFGTEINTLDTKTADDWYLAVHRAYETLRSEYDECVIVGNSMGGALALQLAANTRPAALILFAPFWKLEHILWWALPALKIVVPRFKPFRLFKPDFANAETRRGILTFLPDVDLDDPTIRQAVLDFTVPVSMLDHIRQTGARGQQAAPRIACPTLVIQGKGDELVLPAVTRQLIQRIGGNVTYREIAGTHELAQTPDSWERMRPLLTDFIQTLAEETRPT